MLACLVELAYARVNGSGPMLAHVQNLTVPGMSGVLRWWCGEQGHAADPLCVRHEVSLQIGLTHGTERWQLQQRRQRMLGEGAQQELARAVSAYCVNASQLQRNSGICKRASEQEQPRVPMMEQLVAMQTWWCLQQGHSLSLSCQRHDLQGETGPQVHTQRRSDDVAGGGVGEFHASPK